jgi:hypothetical protein
MKLIQQLRSQLPPEAAESLDELEGMAGSEGAEEDELAVDDAASDSEDELAGDEMLSDEEEPAEMPAGAKKKKKSDKLAFFS